MTSRLYLLIAYFSLQKSSFDDPFCTNETFRGKLAIFHQFFKIKLPKLYTIVCGVTNL